MADVAMTPYTISVPDEAIADLRQRLSFARIPQQLEDSDPWQSGVPVREMERLTTYWRDKFDWKKAEVEINELPNFCTQIDVDGFGKFDIHFLHQVSSVKGAVPLLFSHGWPGSFMEVTKLLPLLKGNDGGPAFHVVAPSLPNFGFSSGTNQRGFGITKYAETLHKLMLKLGYDRYVTQGGDWGFWITRAIGYKYPEHCLGSLINMALAKPPAWTENPLLALRHAVSPYTDREKRGRERSSWFQEEGYGYNLLQSTKPQTIGFALADSPVALLAWIYEKLHDWTDGYMWTEDEILTFVSIYWFSRAGPASSVRIYYEAAHTESHSEVTYTTLQKYVARVKLGIAHFPREISIVPHSWAATMGPVVQQTVHDRGGHFAAWEQPQAIASDLQKMFGRGGPCFGIIEGKDGYE